MTGQLLAQQRRTFARSEIALSKANHHNSPQLLPMRNGTEYSSTQLNVSLHGEQHKHYHEQERSMAQGKEELGACNHRAGRGYLIKITTRRSLPVGRTLPCARWRCADCCLAE